jgi:hypothetical protein
MDPLDIHGYIHRYMDVDVPLGSMDVDVTNIHGYPSSAFTASTETISQSVCRDEKQRSKGHNTLWESESGGATSH